MAGSRKDVRARLLRAAVELFAQHGYDRTTAADIAARADVTERTFFRHFPDKREALFDGESDLQRALEAAIADVPEGPGPATVLHQAFLSMVPALTRGADLKRLRQPVVLAAPELRERELTKEAHLAECAARALEARGVARSVSALAAVGGVAVLSRARLAWLADPGVDYATELSAGFADLRAASGWRDRPGAAPASPMKNPLALRQPVTEQIRAGSPGRWGEAHTTS